MNIKDVKTAFKIADVVLDKQHKQNYIKIDYLLELIDEKGNKLEKSILRDDAGRVYIIAVDRMIKKIGGSQSKGGIKATLSFYQSAMQGGPSLHSLIKKELEKHRKVEIYIIISSRVKVMVKGLFSQEMMEVSVFKEMKQKCQEDYLGREGKYPIWNFKEVTNFGFRVSPKSTI